MTEKQKGFIDALLAFQAEAPMVLKTADNPFFKSKYADLPAVWGTIRDLMAKHKLVVTNTVAFAPERGRDELVTTIVHTPSGEHRECVLPINPAKADPQGYGAAITYHRRQAIVAILGLVCEHDDDDGNEASGNTAKAKPKEPETTPQQEFLKTAAAELANVQSPGDIDAWKRKHGAHFVALSAKQREWLDKKVADAAIRIAQNEATPED